MPTTPEQQARLKIDEMLTAAGWKVQDRRDANPAAGRGVAIREFPMKPGFGEADYLLYVDGMAVGVVEAKKEGSTLTGFEVQTEKYSQGLPEALPAPRKPLPFVNRNGQVTIRNTGLPGNDKFQHVYQLACSCCGYNYGANGSDIFQRKCPKCHGGEPGLALPLEPKSARA